MPDRTQYNARCAERWGTWALRDAVANFDQWVGIESDLGEMLTAYKRDNLARDLAGNCHNPDGTLSGYCWNLSDNFAEQKGQLGQLLDFNESSQTVFLRRGLLIFLTIMLEQIEARGSQPTELFPT